MTRDCFSCFVVVVVVKKGVLASKLRLHVLYNLLLIIVHLRQHCKTQRLKG